MIQKVSIKEASERMYQPWGPLNHTVLNSWDQEAAKLRQLYEVSTILVDISVRIQDSLRELEQLARERT